MSEPFLGEIKMISWNYPPKGWAFCNGQFMPINQNQALFALFGVMYGGNGQTTFALPDLRGRSPFHVGNGLNTQGQVGGEIAHTLSVSEMPAHFHSFSCNTNTGTVVAPLNNVWAATTQNPYVSNGNSAMAPESITNTGGSQAHNNLQPYLVINFIVALQGIFPSRN
ncbi:MAG TPA: tail fiber protein [Pyrinomonadaceae bacterium]|jgi:microcystin-dependent protein